MASENKGWIGVDLDGTLAYYDKWRGIEHVGAPIPAMLSRVLQWLGEGKEVRIFTARVAMKGRPEDGPTIDDIKLPIEKWCVEHVGKVLEITHEKDMAMVELWDDRAVQVLPNTGIRADAASKLETRAGQLAAAPTGIEKAVCEDITRRQQLGIAKYGQTVSDNPLSLKQWLQHALEEALDQAVYLKRAISEIDSKTRLVDSAAGEHVRYASALPGALPIRPGEPGYDEAPYEVMLMWSRK